MSNYTRFNASECQGDLYRKPPKNDIVKQAPAYFEPFNCHFFYLQQTLRTKLAIKIWKVVCFINFNFRVSRRDTPAILFISWSQFNLASAPHVVHWVTELYLAWKFGSKRGASSSGTSVDLMFIQNQRPAPASHECSADMY